MDRSEVNHGLNYAAEVGCLEKAKAALDMGAEIDAKIEGVTALICAARYGHDKIVTFLLSKGADKNIQGGQDGRGWTALMYAAFYGYLGLVMILVEAGADTALRDRGNRTALDLAVANKNVAVANKYVEVEKYLREHGAM